MSLPASASNPPDRNEPENDPPAPVEAKPRINRAVFWGTAVGVVAITVWAAAAPDSASSVIGAVVDGISKNFGWFYFLVVAAVLLFVIFLAITRVGNTKLGPDHSKPQFNLFTWGSMLFAAGIGVDLMFFSVSEPVTQYLAPPVGEGQTLQAARQAMVWTLFHYGLAGWGLYALMGLALGYFAYRHNLPLSIRSALYPIFGKRIHGPVGDGVDIAAMLGTIFGIATSLGIGVAQLNFGLSFLFGVPESLAVQAALIVLAVAITAVSSISGVDKGIRRLAELNVVLAIGLMLFILFAGKTSFLLDSLVQNVGDFFAMFPGMALNTFAYDRPDDWLNSWTLFFWAWWIAWAPFVGLFLARISRGRTIRQFVFGCLTVPFAFIAIWIVIFGNSALDIVMGGNQAFGEVALNQPERAFYSLLEQYPAVPLSAGIATFTGLLFYITSADSGALVMSNFSARLKDPAADGPKWSRLFWAIATGALTLAMLAVGGIPTLQNATIIMGLPFSFVLVLIMLGLYKALQVEQLAADSFRSSLPAVLSGRAGAGERGRNWKHRLGRVMSYPGPKSVDRFVQQTVLPALTEVAEEFRAQGLAVQLENGLVASCGINQVDLQVTMGAERDFKYQVYPVRYETPSYASRMARSEDTYYRLEVFSQSGSHSYDLMGYAASQIITDVLDHYERHLEFLHLNRGNPGASSVADDAYSSEASTQWEQDFELEEETK
ncbi:choline BCCT transporter BetT [Arthrobacter russicus]|jgi:choline/glycine/proline betaine transport protein|uniref:Choline/glycine/proline betaine transport protein n=1 Tax=Arthrobacter russicus TaxID=172040 RepID=A0ABU1JC05_9MICC|nr:choline BCCT transporter BetT [Arthrobacter russicus]MDR6269416.1 choline/glycine/proline betaine transport protein [Arthrobacter russicus]